MQGRYVQLTAAQGDQLLHHLQVLGHLCRCRFACSLHTAHVYGHARPLARDGDVTRDVDPYLPTKCRVHGSRDQVEQRLAHARQLPGHTTWLRAGSVGHLRAACLGQRSDRAGHRSKQIGHIGRLAGKRSLEPLQFLLPPGHSSIASKRLLAPLGPRRRLIPPTQIIVGPEHVGQHAHGVPFQAPQLARADRQVGRHIALARLLDVAPGQHVIDAPGVGVRGHVAAGAKGLDGLGQRYGGGQTGDCRPVPTDGIARRDGPGHPTANSCAARQDRRDAATRGAARSQRVRLLVLPASLPMLSNVRRMST